LDAAKEKVQSQGAECYGQSTPQGATCEAADDHELAKSKKDPEGHQAGAPQGAGRRSWQRVEGRIAVGISGGKDSAAALDMVCRYRDDVIAFFMYLVPELSFQKAYIEYVRKRYGVDVLVLPSWELGHMLRRASFRFHTRQTRDVPVLSVRDTELFVKHETGAQWIAYGHRTKESIVRLAYLKTLLPHGVDDEHGLIYPILSWSKHRVLSYIKLRRIKLSPETRYIGRSFSSLRKDQVEVIRDEFPEDYEKIRRFFPLVEAAARRPVEAPGVRGRGDKSRKNQRGSVQPSDNHHQRKKATQGKNR